MALVITISLVNCKGKDGDPGPAGPSGAQGPAGPQGPAGENYNKSYENGFMKGTIKGTRRDGTAFEESFEYKMAFWPEGFDAEGGNIHSLYLYRSYGMTIDEESEKSLGMNILVTNKDQNPTAALDNFSLNFTKELPGKFLFILRATPDFNEVEMHLPMSRATNATYKSVEYGTEIIDSYDQELQEMLIAVRDIDRNTIFFESKYTNTADEGYSYGRFKYIVDKNGAKSTTSTKFSPLVIAQDPGHDDHSFRTSSGTDLSEDLTIPADTQEITNFSYNASTGVVSFNYKVSVNEFRHLRGYYSSENTTRHALEISGSVSATVYNGVVMRKGFE